MASVPVTGWIRGEETDPRDVAARLDQRPCQSSCDHVIGHADDRNPRCDSLDGANWWAAATDHERLDLGLDQLARRVRKPRVRNTYAASIDDQVAALDQTIAAQLIEQRGHYRRSARIGI